VPKTRAKNSHAWAPLTCINNFVLSTFPAKMPSWGIFLTPSYRKPDFGRLFSLLLEAAQMTQNKKKALF
jgi:hypothetical protein